MTTSEPRSVLIWDAPVRIFHWLMVLSFFGAFVTAESERWRLLHITLGYTMAGLVAFRLLWGLVGTRHARFSDFLRGPRAVRAYLRSLKSAQPEHHAGHNPAGAVAIVALLMLAVAVSASGWAIDSAPAVKWMQGVHDGAANAMMAVVLLHIVGVVVSSWLHHENLVAAMLTGRKLGTPQEGIRRAWRSVAVLMLAAVLGFWWTQWQARPAADAPAQHSSAPHPEKVADGH